MNGKELHDILQSNTCTHRFFKGVFARDGLPKDNRYPSAYVVNTAPMTHRGEHWVAIVLKSSRHGVFFDSFGRRPEFYGNELIDFFRSHVTSYECFNVAVQAKTSSMCGLFVLTFLMLYLCFDFSLQQIVTYFDSDRNVNDQLVSDFVNQYYMLQ